MVMVLLEPLSYTRYYFQFWLHSHFGFNKMKCYLCRLKRKPPQVSMELLKAYQRYATVVLKYKLEISSWLVIYFVILCNRYFRDVTAYMFMFLVISVRDFLLPEEFSTLSVEITELLMTKREWLVIWVSNRWIAIVLFILFLCFLFSNVFIYLMTFNRKYWSRRRRRGKCQHWRPIG